MKPHQPHWFSRRSSALVESEFGVFLSAERGKLKNPKKNHWSKLARTNDKLNSYDTELELNPGHVGERQVLSPLHHSCSPLLPRAITCLHFILFTSKCHKYSLSS